MRVSLTVILNYLAMGRRTTIEERNLIITHFRNGYSQRNIAKMVNRYPSTVQHIIERYNNENRVENKSRVAPNKVFNVREERWIVREIANNPKKSAPKLRDEVERQFGKRCNPETIRRVLRKNNLNGRTARNKPFISQTNRLKRLQFAREHVNKDLDFWNSVIFADETKINLFGSDGKISVWRKPNEELKLKNMKATLKHGGGGVMLWGCMSSAGVGNIHFIEGNMNQYMYLNILRQHLGASAEKLGINGNYRFYQDNDPKHTAYRVRSWLLYNCPQVVKTPPQSPDLNVIENLWLILKKKVNSAPISNKNELKVKITEEWNTISPEYTRKLVESMPRRLQCVIDNDGGPTKY